jgi:hypothetical protein
MGQEFTIKSEALESKINQLLPTQGGYGAGLDLTGSTQIIPIVDLTESATGSSLRPDLQVSFAFNSITEFSVNNADTAIIQNAGFFRIFGNNFLAGTGEVIHKLGDGASTKQLFRTSGTTTNLIQYAFDYIIYLRPGDSFNLESTSANVGAIGNFRQVADNSGNIISPSGFVFQ